MWQATVRRVSETSVGSSPTALSLLFSSINGLSPFANSSGCSRAGKESDALDTEPCATCGAGAGGGSKVVVKRCPRCREVAYCDVLCQRLHWFTHKQYCPILKSNLYSLVSLDQIV
ncbi:unnamed protein product [Protopolystoma xenopodis]|uniref:MYND-type domain-containing protein n=1 Tax=Protopolystoma xenopodis TaxID=117903 RepID=A0A3S5CS13_9PLAT|nr:unnamed protein product [Protopolystoma xenopodis]